jgi:hypothetical protein
MRRSRGPSPRHTAEQERRIADFIAQHGVEKVPEHVEVPPAPVVRVPKPKLKKTAKQMAAINKKIAAARKRTRAEMMRQIRELAHTYKSEKRRKKPT